ncbi:MAG: ATP-binding protein [Candidatus Metalachnospira sp.]|nr:ATP-binding protein [Candidatus Metalachnospira sp.]
MISPKRMKIISWVLGIAAFISAYFAVPLDNAYDLYFLPGMIIPIFVAMVFGAKYAFICCLPGLAMFMPFVAVTTNGWSNMALSIIILVWSFLNGVCRDLIKKGSLPFFAQYFCQVIFLILYLPLNKYFVRFLVGFNHSYFTYAFSYLPDNIINANTTLTAEIMTIYVFALNIVLCLPSLRKLQGQKVSGYDSNNYKIIMIIALVAGLAATISTGSGTNNMLFISFSVNSYQSNIGNIQLMLLKEILVLFAGDFILHFLNYKYSQEQDKLEMAEIQRAVFESSNDLIWCVSGDTGKLLTYNSAAQYFFGRKNEGYEAMNFIDFFNKEERDLWEDYFDKTIDNKDYCAEYFDSDSKRYYNLKLHWIELGDGKCDISAFAKDITDEMELNEKIRSMNDELENRVLERTKKIQEANNELEKFCYTVAHELKAPLRAISLYNDIIKEENEEDLTKESEYAVDNITMYCGKSLKLIGDILEYSKMKSQKLKLVRVNMNKLVEADIDEIKILNPERDIRVNMPRLPVVMADEFLLMCAVHNIMSNSVKYSAKKQYTEIIIDYEETAEKYIFQFTDNGAGFDMEGAVNIFELFNRMHPDTEYEGSGVGLATVKNIIEKHGGRISIKSAVDNGCTVMFSLLK